MGIGWLRTLSKVGPAVLMFTPLAPFSSIITSSISIAEQLGEAHDLSGAQKKVLAIELSKRAAEVINQIKGKEVINVSAVEDTVDNGIDTIVSATNVIHKETE